MLLIGKVARQYPVPRTLSPFKGVRRMWLATVLEEEQLLLHGHK